MKKIARNVLIASGIASIALGCNYSPFPPYILFDINLAIWWFAFIITAVASFLFYAFATAVIAGKIDASKYEPGVAITMIFFVSCLSSIGLASCYAVWEGQATAIVIAAGTSALLGIEILIAISIRLMDKFDEAVGMRLTLRKMANGGKGRALVTEADPAGTIGG